MKLIQNRITRIFICFLITLGAVQFTSAEISLGDGLNLRSIIIEKQALFPEDLKYDPYSDRFIVGSFREGAVYAISMDGAYEQLIDDPRLHSVLGIQIDFERDKIFVTSSDIGSSHRPFPGGPNKAAFLGVYKFSTGEPIDFINLAALSPNDNHLANGIALDSEGNTYITDSFSPRIYKVDLDGNASTFLEDDVFRGKGINLNGIVYHPDGYLITIKKSDGTLYKIPIDSPSSFSAIDTPRTFVGGDGLILTDNNDLIVIANQASGKITETVFSLKSKDHWGSAEVVEKYTFDPVYLTTGAVRNDEIFVLHSNINSLVTAPHEMKGTLNNRATIQKVGTFSRRQ
jgi:hypothetical protein